MNISPFNGLKCLAHADKIKRIISGEIPFPVCAQLDLSNHCNHACRDCFYAGYRERDNSMMEPNKAFFLLEELRSLGVQSVLFTGGGEPLTHPHISRILRKAHSLGFKIGMSTNGGLLNKTGVWKDILACNTYVRVSLDAGKPETHERIHGVKGQFDSILSSVKTMRVARTALGAVTPTTGYAFLISDDNLDDIAVAIAKADLFGFDYIQFRPIIDGNLSDESRERANTLLAMIRESGAYTLPILGGATRQTSKNFDRCRVTPLLTIIGADLNVYLCCQWRGDLGHSIGSVANRSFADVWLSDAHREMLSRLDHNCCHPCKYEKYNEVIDRVLVNNQMHLEFL